MARTRHLGRVPAPFLAVLGALGIALGQLDAVCAVFLRRLLDVSPTVANLGPAVLDKADPRVLGAESGREVALVVILGAVAWLVGRSPAEKLGVLLVTAGTALLARSAALKLLIGWPTSLQAREWLWMLPQPVFCPLWIPLTAAAAALMLGLWLLGVARGGKA